MTDTIDETGGAEALGGYFEDRPDPVGDTYVDIAADNPAARLMEAEAMRMAEALVFASSEPVSEKALAARLPDGVDVRALMEELRDFYDKRGVNLVRIENAWAFRTAGDLGFLMQREEVQQRKLSRAALEVLAIIAYHQPITRAEMEDIRGVETSKGTIDVLMETGWVKMRGRRKTPGRPVTYGTTAEFLDHFGLSEIRDLPGMEELKGAGLLSSRMPAGFSMPLPSVDPDELTEEEEELTDIDLEELGLLTPKGGDD
ncbi:SMC-Scp complex subunit ScpB [Oricola sp.]|uniref:SMC-Scp complex subunit ScpB n=1 Tax=Oricola sp. TaxID=1979950 RepID=UPI000C90CD5F|nr:SMC-Scp complex subunit ScpB [Ahrensia sp.]|tara:strand:+ start:46801 stop:47574 length:774 start_codon:yes stop_codon:yes gene_type:complete